MPLRSLSQEVLLLDYTMKLYDFLRLADESQYDAVWQHGVHIDNIIFEKVNYVLYSVNDFFVEVHYDVATNKIIGKLPFKSGEPLDKYLRGLPNVNDPE
jgi:hypothetical protein